MKVRSDRSLKQGKISYGNTISNKNSLKMLLCSEYLYAQPAYPNLLSVEDNVNVID